MVPCGQPAVWRGGPGHDGSLAPLAACCPVPGSPTGPRSRAAVCRRPVASLPVLGPGLGPPTEPRRTSCVPQTLPPGQRNLSRAGRPSGRGPSMGLLCWKVASDRTVTARLATPLRPEEGPSPWHSDSGRTPAWPRQGRVGQEAPSAREAVEGPTSRAQRGGLRQRQEGGGPHAAQAGDRQGLSTGLSSLPRVLKQAETQPGGRAPCPHPKCP